jgi:microcystin-dependent protein
MVFKVPNGPDVSDINQSEPDNGDYVALGHRSTGVTSGGGITALGTPAMSVQVAASTVVIDGLPYSFNAATASIGAATSEPRFDLVGWTSAGVTVVAGTPDANNPRFPTFDPALFCFGAAIYVRSGVSTIVGQDIVAKAIGQERSFRRSYAADTDIAYQTVSPAGSHEVTADGSYSWGSNVLKRLSSTAMEFVTRLTLRGGAILLARATSPESEKLLSIQSNGGTELAYVTGTGKLYADNRRFGTGSPEGAVTAAKGVMYIDEATPDNGTVWIKTTSTGNTGWKALRTFDPSESALPTGTIIPWLGLSSDTRPTGTVLADGSSLAASGANLALFNLIQYRFGGSGANFNVPDLRGKYIFGSGGAIAAAPGASVGTSNGQVTLSVTNIPTHSHVVNDPGHYHPQAGPYWYYRPNIYHNNWHPNPDNSTALPHMWVDDSTTGQRTAKTGVSVNNTGDGQPFNVLPPSVAINYLIKL